MLTTPLFLSTSALPRGSFAASPQGARLRRCPRIFSLIFSKPYSITVKLYNMIKPIYRTAIANKYDEVIFVTNKFYLDKQFAVNLANVIPCEKEEEINIHKWRSVVINECGHSRWQPFEIVKNDNNKRYIGIITETMVCEE